MKPRVFVASPLFNAPQIAIISRIETALAFAGYDFYSARLHSGSDKMTPEDRKDIRKWDPVFESNEQGLMDCRVMIAVLEYALPEGKSLGLADKSKWDFGGGPVELTDGFTPLELPDSGTVWEMGHFRAQGKIVLGFHTNKAAHLNLMLTHGVDGMLQGFDSLDRFLVRPFEETIPGRLMDRIVHFVGNDDPMGDDAYQNACLFDWSATSDWDAGTKEVE